MTIGKGSENQELSISSAFFDTHILARPFLTSIFPVKCFDY